MIALVTGGSGSGKSAWAEALTAALPAERRVYLATMQVCDRESVRRVERHRTMRAGRGFETVECPLNLSPASIAPGSLVLLEDIPNLLANEMFDPVGDPGRILPALEGLARRCSHLVAVTNDVFCDGMDYDPSTTEYLYRLAEINRRFAALADCAVEVVCGIPIFLKGEAPCV